MINLSKYELSSTDKQANIVAVEHLNNRADNLALLEQYGSNAWLIGNAVQENFLGILERELERLKEEGTNVNRQRKGQNLEVGAEISSLERRWKNALRGSVEVEIENALLELEIKKLEGMPNRS